MEDKEKYMKAKARVHAIKGFYMHLIVYVIVNIILFLINLFNKSATGWWFYWPLIGWGIGIIINAWFTFVPYGVFGSKWEDEKIKKYMDKDK